MKDLREAAYILRIKIIRDISKRLIALSQSAYLEKILKKFRMQNSKKSRTSMEAVSMRKFIDGLGDVMPSNKRPMKMLCDNEHAIAIAADLDILKGARHFQRKYHYIRELIQEREIVLKKVHTDDNVAYLFTKPMSFNKHFEHVMATEIVSASSLM
ncbi:hypothetical protein Tco_1356429 [Tanacetum coccineum]